MSGKSSNDNGISKFVVVNSEKTDEITKSPSEQTYDIKKENDPKIRYLMSYYGYC